MSTSPEASPIGLRPVASPVFASHIDVYAVEDCAPLNSELLALIAEWQKSDNGITASNQLGWHSPPTLFTREEPAFRKLFDHFLQAVTITARRNWKDFDPFRNVVAREGWANVNGKGAFNAVHEHDTFHFSGAYYVAVGKQGPGRSGAIEFLNPAGISAMPLPNRSYIMPPKIALVPNAGNLIIFPSYLRHWVYPNQDEEERVSIAFNIRFGPSAR